MFVAAAMAVLGLSGLFIGHRLIVPSRLPRWGGVLAWAVVSSLVVGVLWLPLTWYLPIDLDRIGLWWAQHWINFVSMGIFVFLGIAVGIREVILGADWLLQRRSPKGRDPRGTSRRQLLHQGVNAGVLVGAGVVGAGAFGAARRRAAVARVQVPIDGLPEGLAGFRIVQITDLHVGNTIGRGYVAEVAETVDGLAADMVVITGDLTDGVVRDLRRDVEPLGGMRSRHGTFFVTGNHDYYYDAAEDWVAEVARLGMTPLINEHRVIQHGGGRLLLAGVADHGAESFVPSHRCDPVAAVAGAPDADARVLLAHQPRTLDLAAPLGFDLQLSGHTHGGQMLPFHALALLQQPYLAGLHPVGRGWIYVSRGTGYWGPPFRTAAPSEITLITLTAGQGASGSERDGLA